MIWVVSSPLSFCFSFSICCHISLYLPYEGKVCIPSMIVISILSSPTTHQPPALRRDIEGRTSLQWMHSSAVSDAGSQRCLWIKNSPALRIACGGFCGVQSVAEISLVILLWFATVFCGDL